MKTVSEAAKEYAEKAVPQFETPESVILTKAYKIGFEAGVEFAQQWYSVDDGFPENFGYGNKDVFIKILFDDKIGTEEQIHINKRIFTHRIGWLWNLSYFEKEWKTKIIAWRPIEILIK